MKTKTASKPSSKAAPKGAQKAAPAAKRKAAPAKRPRFSAIMDIYSELKKVIWPTRQQAINLTIIVLVVSVAMAIFLGIIDYGFSRLMSEVLTRWP